jgi:FKBP-type peptidyl-prolyl cis-trans isomerase
LRKGARHRPKSYDTVVANYRGWLDNGHTFDSSYERGKPTEFSLSQVVPGWTEGLQLVGEGGMIELEIPSRLGYGARGMPPHVPPNSTLHFIVELVKIK